MYLLSIHILARHTFLIWNINVEAGGTTGCDERLVSVQADFSSSTGLRERCTVTGVTLSMYYTNVVLCSISCSVCDMGLFQKHEFLVYAAYTHCVRYPHIKSSAFQPWRVKIAMAFSKELPILWLHSCPLPLVLASPDVSQCFAFTNVWKQQQLLRYAPACFLPCQLMAVLKAHSANLLITVFLGHTILMNEGEYCWGCSTPQRYLQPQFAVLKKFSTLINSYFSRF